MQKANPAPTPASTPAPTPFDIRGVGSNELPKTTTLKRSHKFTVAGGSGTVEVAPGGQVKVLGLLGDQVEVAYLDSKSAIPYRETTIESEIANVRAEIRKRDAERLAKEEQLRIARERKEREEAEKVASRQKKIESQFSAWDGSHRGLTSYIKKSMNDPSSYKHDETRYSDAGDYLIVITRFRGKNAFGGVVLNTIKAKVDLDGNVISILSQE